MAAALVCRRLEALQQPLFGKRADRDHQKIKAAAQNFGTMLRHGLLARDFGYDRRIAREEIGERFNNIDSQEAHCVLSRAPRPAQRADNFNTIAGLAQRSDHVLRDAAMADQSDTEGRHIRMPVNFHCDNSSIV